MPRIVIWQGISDSFAQYICNAYMQTILYDSSPSIQDSAFTSDHSKLTYPQLFSPFRVFPPNQLPPNYPIAQQYHSFRIILRYNSATTAGIPKPKHLVTQKNCTAAEAAQFWRLTCAPNQRFGQVIKKHPISRAIARKTGSLRFYHRAANAVFYLSYLITKLFLYFFSIKSRI